jgi:hypothetical protein
MNRRAFLHVGSLAVLVPLAGREWWRAIDNDPDELICKAKFELAVSRSLHLLLMNNVVAELGKSFLGTPYRAHALEQPGEERLVVNMRGLDCVSFCENAIALARCVKQSTMTFEDYRRELQFIRYRNGVINGYPSRLHYFVDFIHDNERKGVLNNITQEMGGKPYKKRIHFMTSNVHAYRQLKENPAFVEEMRRQEEAISRRSHYYVPKEEVRSAEKNILSGDILAFTTDINGLDVSHTGIALWHRAAPPIKSGQERLHLLHAPAVGTTVSITEKPLAEYLAANKRQTGVIVARVREVA